MKLACLFVVAFSAVLMRAEPTQSATNHLGIVYSPTKVSANAAAAEPPPPGVVVLPKFDVRDARIKLDEQDLLTAKGILESAQKQYLTPLYQAVFGPLVQLGTYYLNFNTIGTWHPNETEALDIYWAHERLYKISKFNELIDLVRLTDPKQALELEKMRVETFRFEPEALHMMQPLRPHR
jgi:hypothetical protein